MRLLLSIFTISLMFMTGCKQNEVTGSNKNNKHEELYFEDYESPMFKWGFIDKKGEIVISAKFDNTRDFSEGLAAVNFKGRWGYINDKGKNIINYKYRAAYNFSSGLALVQEFNYDYHFINNEGIKVFDHVFDEANSFHNGISRVMKKGRFEYIDKTGTLIVNSNFENGSNFRNGYAVINDEDGENIINDLGEKILAKSYLKCYLPNEGRARVKTSTGIRFILLDNKKEIEIDFVSATDFYNSVAAVKNQEWFLIDSENIKISDNYDLIEYGGDSVWIVTKDNKKGIINNQGEPLTSMKYDIIYHFSDGMSSYSIDDMWGFIHVSGAEITPPLFPLAWEFRNGMARAIFNGGIGFIDLNGKVAIHPKYIEVRDFYEGRARVQVVN